MRDQIYSTNPDDGLKKGTALTAEYLDGLKKDEWFALRPQVAFAWLAPSLGLGTESVYTGSATRWRFV